MTPPNLDRLKAVSLAAFQLWKSSRKPSQDLFNAFNMANCIVIDILRLAEENERLKTAIHDCIERPKGVVPNSALEFYDMRGPAIIEKPTPASAGGGKE